MPGCAEIGTDQRITPLEALEAQMMDVAYQYGEQDLKGSLEPGKLADVVIRDGNPPAAELAMIKTIMVETIKEGRTVYRRAP